MKYAGIASALVAGGLGISALVGPGQVHGTPIPGRPYWRMTCQSYHLVLQPPVGMPADYVFKLCGFGVPQGSFYCPNGLPQPGHTGICTFTLTRPARK